jgi:hypothetical protein
MHGMLELSDIGRLDLLIDRRPGEPDLKAGNLRLLFEAGFQAVEIGDFDLQRLTTDVDYVCELWLRDGHSEDQIARVVHSVYPEIRKQCLHKLAVIDRFSSQYIHVARPAEPADLHSMIANRWHVSCEVVHSVGWAHNILVVQAKSAMYQIFDPMIGLILSHKDQVASTLYPGFRAFYHPD